MNWKIGQKLVCIHSFSHNDAEPPLSPTIKLPKKNEVVTFAGEKNNLYIYLNEYMEILKRVSFHIADFRPLDYDVTYDELFEKYGSPETLDVVPQIETI